MALVSFGIIATVLLRPALRRKRRQAAIYLSAFMVPSVGGLGTEAYAPLAGLSVMPLTAILTTFLVLVIGISLYRREFLGLTDEMMSERVLSSMFDPVLLVSSDGEIQFSNRAAERLFGNVVRNEGVAYESLMERQGEFDEQGRERVVVRSAGGQERSAYVKEVQAKTENGREVGKLAMFRMLGDSVRLLRKLEESARTTEKQNETLERVNRLLAGREKRLEELTQILERLPRDSRANDDE
jgi:PAS domain-containing protein